MKMTLIFGRLALGLLFLVSGLSKVLNYNATLQVMDLQGVPLSSLLLPVATGIELVGGLLLILGLRVKTSALTLALYLVPVSWFFHPFWAVVGEARQTQSVHFLKNLSIIGGLTLVYAYQRILDSFSAGTLTTIRRESFERRKAA